MYSVVHMHIYASYSTHNICSRIADSTSESTEEIPSDSFFSRLVFMIKLYQEFIIKIVMNSWLYFYTKLTLKLTSYFS